MLGLAVSPVGVWNIVGGLLCSSEGTPVGPSSVGNRVEILVGALVSSMSDAVLVGSTVVRGVLPDRNGEGAIDGRSDGT